MAAIAVTRLPSAPFSAPSETPSGSSTKANSHRAGTQRVAARAGRAEQQPDDRGLDRGQHDRGGKDQPELLAHQREIDRHADAHEEQREQQPAERFDVGLELMAIVGAGEQHAGQERAERHRHADGLHQQRGAEHDQERRRGHHLARAGLCQEPERRIEQIAPGQHERRDRRPGAADGKQIATPIAAAAVSSRRKQRQQREQRHRRHVLEQQNRERALAVGALEMPAVLEDPQRDRGCRERERDSGDEGAAPGKARRKRQRRDRRGSEGKLRRAETENIAPHGEQAGKIELQPDQEQQQHDAELRDRQDGFGRTEDADAPRTDQHAGRQIRHDGGETDAARDRHADDRGGEQHDRERQKAEFGGLGIHGRIHHAWGATDRCDLLASRSGPGIALTDRVL